MRNPKNPSEEFVEKEVLVGYKEIAPAFARWINKSTVNHAERFLFSASNDEKIKEIFNKTKLPERLVVSSPFSSRKKLK